MLLHSILLSMWMPSLFLNHNRRLGFPTTLCTLNWGHSLSSVENDGVKRSTCTEISYFSVYCLASEH